MDPLKPAAADMVKVMTAVIDKRPEAWKAAGSCAIPMAVAARVLAIGQMIPSGSKSP